MKRKVRRGLYAPELLESRIAPATIVVTSLADDGGGALKTLREAIVEANGTPTTADTITFDPAILPGTITLAGAAEIDITGTLTIKGPGIDKLTISGANASRIFDIADGDDAVLHPTTISGLTFLDGNATGDGGAIRSTESLTLSRIVIASSTATGDGGGVHVHTKGKVRIDNTHFIGNDASDSGGGLYAQADGGITVTKCLVSGNIAGNNAGGLRLRGEPKAASILVDFSTFIGNSAGNGGGGLLIDRGNEGTATVRNSTFSGNTATSEGGALYLNDGRITLDRCVFSHNTAGTDGGAIADNFIDALVIKSSRFDGNTADRGGALYAGGVHPVTITGSLFTANKSTVTTGGAIDAGSGVVLTVKSSTFAGNTATTNGGAIALHNAGTSLVLASSTVSGNAGVNGGGIFADTGAKLTVTGGVFAGNSATGGGGGIHTEGTGANAVNVSVARTFFHGNRADSGGAMDTRGAGAVVVKGAKVLGNFATSNAGGMYLVTSTTILVQSSLFMHNVADMAGGGLVLYGDLGGTGKIVGSKFIDNDAGTEGGGIAAFQGTFEMMASLVTGNVAGVRAGGIVENGGTVNRISAIVTGNWAPAFPNIFP